MLKNKIHSLDSAFFHILIIYISIPPSSAPATTENEKNPVQHYKHIFKHLSAEN